MRKKETAQSVGMGVGYVSVMLIFAVICLTIFAVLSFKAALSNDMFNERSGEFLKQYYAADTSAKEMLSRINDCAFEAKESPFFEDEFEEIIGDIDGVDIMRKPDGFSVSYSIEINERQVLAVELQFDSEGSYTINKWQSQTVDWENSGSHINVWDGSF